MIAEDGEVYLIDFGTTFVQERDKPPYGDVDIYAVEGSEKRYIEDEAILNSIDSLEGAELDEIQIQGFDDKVIPDATRGQVEKTQEGVQQKQFKMAQERIVDFVEQRMMTIPDEKQPDVEIFVLSSMVTWDDSYYPEAVKEYIDNRLKSAINIRLKKMLESLRSQI